MMGLSIVVSSSFRLMKAARQAKRTKVLPRRLIVRVPSGHWRIHGDAASSRVNATD
jgi:hypothetical protein